MRAEEIKGLMEAYSKVHETPEVLNEEVLEENIEVVDEQRLPGPQRRAAQQAATERRNVAAAQAPAKPTGTGRGAASRYQAYSRDKGRGGDAAYRAGGGDAAAKGGLTRQQIQQKGMAATRAAAAKPAPTPAAKPAPSAAAAKPSTPAKPAPGTKAAGPESIKPKTPNPLMQRTFGYQKGQAPDQVAKVKAATDQAAKNLSGKGALKSSLDLFDIVKGYLLDEGYAETEQNAIVIMANMSEEWRASIVEQSAIASRAAAVVDDQRRGSHGMSHDQKMTGDSIKKLNKYKGPRVTPGLPGA